MNDAQSGGGNYWPDEARPIRRLFELAAPDLGTAVADAESALAGALSGVLSSVWPEVAWRFSAINGDGYPVEFTFSSAEPGLRYTAEVAGPEVLECRRFRDALRWAGWPGAEDPIARQVRRWQDGPLRWGAWVGGFHSTTRSRRKVYLEATGAADRPLDSGLPPRAVLRLVGVASAGEDREYYFRSNRLELAEVGRLLWTLSLSDCFEPLRQAVTATLPWPLHEYLVPTDAGFSISSTGAVSVFTYARSVWGSDGSIRRNILELADTRGWNFDLYEQVTRPLDSCGEYLTHHGVLAWIAAPNRPVELRVSVRPPG